MKHTLITTALALAAGVILAAETAAPGAAGINPQPEEKKAPMSETANPVVLMSTSMGDITIELFADKAPLSVANFLAYVDDKFYDGTIFHRIIPNFMNQGGGFTADMRQKPTKAPIKNEADNGLTNDRYTLAMARTSVIDSATSQFFINTTDNGFLNFKNKSQQGYGYAVFGKVTAGMDVVDKMAQVPTGNRGGHQNVPTTPVVINSVTRVAPAAQ